MQELQIQINTLQQEFAQLKQQLTFSSQLPRNVETAFKERLQVISKTGTGTATTQTISLSGDPEDIVVPAQPSGTLKVVAADGQTYELLYK